MTQHIVPTDIPTQRGEADLAARRQAWDDTLAGLRVRLAAWLAEQPEIAHVGDWQGPCLPLAAENQHGEFGVAILMQ